MARPLTPFPRFILVAATWAAVSLTAPAVQAKDGPAPVAMDAEFKPAAVAATLVDLPDSRTLKGLKRVAVPQFNVEFVIADNVHAQTSGFAASGRANASAYYKLVGVAEPDFQALAVGMHATFLNQLKAAGLEVVSPAEVAAAVSYRKLAEGGTPLPLRSDTSITVAPAGMVLYGVNKASSTQAKAGVFGALSAISGVASAIGGLGETVELQKELGGAALFDVSLRVHFVQLSSNTRGFFGRMANSAEVSGKPWVSVQSGKLTVTNAGAVNVMTLKQPLVMDPAAFTELRVQAKSAGDVAGAVALGVLRMAIGSKDTHSSESYEAVADPAKYREVVAAGLASVGELFVARAMAER